MKRNNGNAFHLKITAEVGKPMTLYMNHSKLRFFDALGSRLELLSHRYVPSQEPGHAL